MEDNPYFITLTPEEFHWLWEDIDLASPQHQKAPDLNWGMNGVKNGLSVRGFASDFRKKPPALAGGGSQSAQEKTPRPLEGIKRAVGKADREHVCVDEMGLGQISGSKKKS